MQNLWAKDVQLKRLHVELLSLRLNKNARQNWLAKLNQHVSQRKSVGLKRLAKLRKLDLNEKDKRSWKLRRRLKRRLLLLWKL